MARSSPVATRVALETGPEARYREGFMRRHPFLLSLVGLLASAASACASTMEDADANANATATATVTTLPERMQAITKALGRAMYECPDRVWPGIAGTYRTKSQLLFASEKEGKAFLWNDRQVTAGAAPHTTE